MNRDNKLSSINLIEVAEQNMATIDNIGLYNGQSGMLLYLILQMIDGDNPNIMKEMSKRLNEIRNNLKRDKTFSTTLCDGLAGFGWLLCYMSDAELLDTNDYTFKDIDYILTQQLDCFISENNIDILHGAIGLGLYFLKRGNKSIVEKTILFLDQLSKVNFDGTFWERYDVHREKDFVIDLGLAHGIPGILYFLHKCLEKNILPHQCNKLINGGVTFLLNNIQDPEEVGCYFGNYYISTGYSSKSPQFSRLAWCYGDLGILTLLHLVATTNEQRSILEAQLVATTHRVTQETTCVSDIGICHGSSGLALLYHQLYIRTKNKTFMEISNYWERKTVELYEQGLEQAQNKGLLIGVHGALLMFLVKKSKKLFKNKLKAWQEIFFLS